MATFTSAISVPNIEGFGLNLFEFDAITLLDYEFDAFTTTSYRLYDDNNNEVIYGGNFVQDPVSGAVTGTVTSFLLRDAGVVLLNATGLSVDVASLFEAVQANDTYLFLSLISGEADTITGTAFNDNLWFGQNVGNDIMNGGNGDDYLDGGLDADTLNGGADADFLVGGTGQDIIDGGTTFTNSEDFDTVGYLDEYLYNMGLSGIVANLTDVTQGTLLAHQVIDTYGEVDTVTNVEEILGTGFDDTVYAPSSATGSFVFKGYAGNDTFIGSTTAADELDYRDDARFAETANAELGTTFVASGITVNFASDVVAGNGASGTITDSFGDTDTVSGVDRIRGTFSVDVFNGGVDDEFFRGLKGADIFNGGAGFDISSYSSDSRSNGIQPGGSLGIIADFSADVTANGIAIGTVVDGFGDTDQLNAVEVVEGTMFNDTFTGGADRVEFWSGEGADTFNGGSANDYADTGEDDDTIDGGAGDDELKGGDGTDTIYGGADNDNIRGDEGGNVNQGNDQLFGEAGEDSFKGGAGNDLIDGGADRDRVEYNLETTFTGDDATHGVIVNLSNTALVGVSVAGIASTTVAAGTAIDTRNYVDTLVSIEDVQGTGYDDVIIGNEDDNSLEGYEGNDVLRGGGGNDSLRGDDGGSAAGNDQLFGEAGDDYFKGGAGSDLIDGGADRDRVEYNLETTFTGDDATHGVIVNLSNTALVGVSVAGIASTTVAAGTAIDTRNYVDTLVSIEDVQGTGYDDIIIADGGENSITAYGGNDTVIGGLDNDYLVGGAGNDIIDGGMGGDDFDILGYRDEYIWQNGTQGVQVNLSATTQGGLLSNRAIDAFGTTDIVSNFELVEGTSFDDVVYAGALINEDFEFSGFKGNDQFFGTATGRDRLNYHRDEEFVRDVLEGRGITLVASGITVNFAADSVAGNGASGTVTDSFGDTDTVSGVDFVRGTYFVDTFNGGADDEEFQGLKGADIINGGAGFDVASYYNDREDNGVQVGVANGIVADFSTDLSANGVSVGTVVDGFGTTDQLSDIEAVNGTEFADTFTGGADRVEFWSGGGADTFNGGSANDYADGGDGDDTLSGGGGNDVLNGGADADTLGGGGGRDVGVFAGLASGATLNFAGVTTAVTTGVGGTDTLTNVEVLQFDDRMVVIEDPLTDFNADANSDLLWFRQSDGYAYLWTMDENAQTGSAALGQIGGDWTIQTTGDFNGDGSSDFMWKNTSTGQFYIWNFTNGVQSGGANLGNIGTSWNVRGSGDFNADGNGDIAWRNSDGHIYVYSMNNNVVQSGVSFGIIGSEWDIGAVGDFNGDGSSDIALRRSTDGLVYIWSVENNAIIDGDNLGAIGTNWSIQGAGDFNNDGTDDLLLRDANDGTLYFYFMQNSMVNAGASLGALGTDWLVDTVSDLDGDLQMDLALKNTSTGQFYIYNIENGAISGGANLGVVGTDWELV